MQQLKQLMHKSVLVIAGSVFLGLSSTVMADIKPEIPKGKGEQCVAPTDEMRAHHFEKILHKRDQTMHQGIRTKTNSLKECINCHVPENSSVRFGDDKHFCSSCHNFAGVTIDCFQCHADRPGNIPAIHTESKATPDTNVTTEAATTPAAPATGAAP
jgi:hypothetical protein